jgi:short-subunit dehydrogenase
MNIKDQTILISGAAGSVGTFLTQSLAKEAKKIIAVDRDSIKLDALKNYSNIEVYTCDLSNPVEVVMVMGSILNEYPTTVLINLAGLIHSEPLVNLLKRIAIIHLRRGMPL